MQTKIPGCTCWKIQAVAAKATACDGMLHAQGEILLFSDADLSSPIEEAEKLFATLKKTAPTSRLVHAGYRVICKLNANRFTGSSSNEFSTCCCG
jgi:hypothetical protein